jgi:hypothetical protein
MFTLTPGALTGKWSRPPRWPTASIQRCLRVGSSTQVADGLHTLLPVQTEGNLGLRRLHHG